MCPCFDDLFEHSRLQMIEIDLIIQALFELSLQLEQFENHAQELSKALKHGACLPPRGV